MSRHNLQHAIAADVEHILQDFKRMPKEEAERLYGIEFGLNGTVFDPTYNKEFKSLEEWAIYDAEQNEVGYDKPTGHGKHDYDDYY